ncbi:Phototropin-2 [Glycine soja]
MEKLKVSAKNDPAASSDQADSFPIFKMRDSQNVGLQNSRRVEDDAKAVRLDGGSVIVPSNSANSKEPINKWMAFAKKPGFTVDGNSATKDKSTSEDNYSRNHLNEKSSSIVTEANIAERTAEWGLVVNSGNFKALGGENTSGSFDGDRSRNLSDRFVEPTRTSGESNYGSESSSGVFPRVSQELKEALATLQQTFVVSDATKPDCPIMLFFKGDYWKELGPETDKNEVAKIRDATRNGRSYCGRLLNYKKDGTPFWNLLTITPIKDDHGNTIKFIGMQVEVSKYTEGVNEKALRPNGLPKSLIRYDARQKEKALGSITEVVQTVKDPKSIINDRNGDTAAKPEEQEKFNFDFVLPKSADIGNTNTPGRQASPLYIQRMSSSQDKSRTSQSGRISFKGLKGRSLSSAEEKSIVEPEVLMTKEIEWSNNLEHSLRERDIRQGIDLATTLERIEKNFVISDPRLPDNPIIFASDSFLELTEYTREEILGRNCRFLQGPETDQATVSRIRDAIREQREITGELQYFIGVQLDGSDHVEPLKNRLSETTEQQSAKLVKATAENVDEAVRELPDANLRPEDLWAIHSQPVFPRPHKKENPSWIAIQKVAARGEKIGLQHFVPIRPLGCGDTGSVHLVELKGTGELYAMKAMEKSVMLNRNKVHRSCIEREIISLLDHPFLPTLYTSFQTPTHVCLITDFFPGGELFALLDKQPMKIFKEESARFYAAEVVIGLEYLHCLGIIYRDLKPENILLQKDGHVVLADFDLSYMTSCKPQLCFVREKVMEKRLQVVHVPTIDQYADILTKSLSPSNFTVFRDKVVKQAIPGKRRSRSEPPPTFVAEPVTQSNSFVGTEEYIAPEIITGAGHTSGIDWWTLGILLYEMLYGRTPFRGKNRQKTFSNILHKDLTFPSSIPASLAARQLINALLQRDPTSRIGSTTGANEIKQHPFFRGINWPLIRNMTPPPLDVPLKLIGNDPVAKDIKWEDDGVLVSSIDMDIF